MLRLERRQTVTTIASAQRETTLLGRLLVATTTCAKTGGCGLARQPVRILLVRRCSRLFAVATRPSASGQTAARERQPCLKAARIRETSFSPSSHGVLLTDVTEILSAIEGGDPAASEQLLPLVYDELRRLAAAKLAAEKPGQTLQATALVHEVYLRLVGGDQAQNWDGRNHFFGAAAEAMRRILVEIARRKAGPESGGDLERLQITGIDPTAPDAEVDVDVLALHEALDKLAEKHARKAELVKLRFFAGLTNEQAAQVLGISARTAYTEWSYAKAWLQVEMQ